MEFEWDETKGSPCFERCGFDFAHAVRSLSPPEEDRRAGSPEVRWRGRYRLLGTGGGWAYVVVYTVRRTTVRIISTRKANRKEVAADHEHNTLQD